MFYRVTKYFLCIALFFCTAFLSNAVFAQRPTSSPAPTSRGTGSSALNGGDPTIDIDVYVRGADSAPIDATAVVTLVAMTGQVLSQGTPGYENAVKEFDGYNGAAARVDILMRPASSGQTGAGSSRILLAPKAQKELGKALEALRANKPDAAKSHLDSAYRKAPNHPAVNYLFGVYFLQMKYEEKAKSYWTKALEFDPKHLGALLSLSEALMREGKLADAEAYGKRAVEADPSSWRGHAILADVFLEERKTDEAVKEAERAVELGHGQAAAVQPLLARAFALSGNKERAISVLQTYVQEHPADAAARKQLDDWRSPPATVVPVAKPAALETRPSAATETAVALPLPSGWLPPDVDEKVPPVEPGAVCMLDQVLQKAGMRVQEFVKNVDRYTANELLIH